MSNMLEVLSLERQEPACLDPLEPEDVIRIWNSSQANEIDSGAGVGGMQGRGRGRGRRASDESGEAEEVSEGVGGWSRGGHVSQYDPWDATALSRDGGTAAGGFDLEDFAAASAKFREDMEKMHFNEEKAAVEEDTMEALLRQQERKGAISSGDDDDELGGLLGDDELAGMDELGEADDIPDWADEEDAAALLQQRETEKVPPAETKRNMLLEVLWLHINSDIMSSHCISVA
jgi:hypothetical protein